MKPKQCKSCPWKSDVGNKYVCMFMRCVKDKLNNKNLTSDKEVGKSLYTPEWQFQEPILVREEKIHFFKKYIKR